MKERTQNHGITLTTLIITVIILLILAGVGIGLFGGDGLLQKAQEARLQAEIENEKELVETAAVRAVSKNRYGDITVEELQQELEGDATVEKIRKKIVATINDSQRKYYVDEEGNVFEYEYIDLAIMENGTDFYTRMADYRENILTVTVLDNMNVPENAYKVFDVSKKQDESAKAWLVENQENAGMYDLYIGGNEGVESENCSKLFSEMTNCININLEHLYTENATDFSSMFYKDTNLVNINLKNLDSTNVTSMAFMFWQCSNLKSLDLSNFNTSKLTNMHLMFTSCTKLESVNLSTFNTSNVTSMTQLFGACESIKELDLEHFDTSKLAGWNAGGYYMFAGCISLEELHISSWDVSNLTNMIGMFQNCSSLQSLDLSKWNVGKVTTMNGMFQNCSSLQTLDLSSWNMANVTETSTMFKYCSKLKTIYASEMWGDNSQITSSSGMFFNCTSLSGAIEYSSSKTDATYANYDTGYFTYKAVE